MIETTTFKLKCPKCDYPQYCPCKSCNSKIPKSFKPWIFKNDENVHICANCGSDADIDWWINESYRQLEEWKKSQCLKEI